MHDLPLTGGLVMRLQLAGGFCALSVLLVAGCASQTGVVPNGQGGYLIAKQAATGFPGLGNLKAEAMGEANQYCQGQGREFLLTNETETSLRTYSATIRERKSVSNASRRSRLDAN